MDKQSILKKLIVFSVLFLLTPPSYGLCVKTDKANLRKGPGKKFEVSWMTYQYMPLHKIGKKGNWIKVRDFENDVHWVHKSVVTDEYQCAVVKPPEANLRNGPGMKFGQPSNNPKAARYSTYKFKKLRGKWAHIEGHYDDNYWVYRELVWVN